MSISALDMWFKNFQSTRVNVSFGSPLWAYRLTKKEFFVLETHLKAVFTTKNINTILSYRQSVFKPLTLYISARLQRFSEGEIRRWSDVLTPINIDYNSNDRISLIHAVHTGLQQWGLEVKEDDEHLYFLQTLYCQGGFPLKLLESSEGGILLEYFNAVLEEYAKFKSFESLRDIAVNCLPVLPKTLQQASISTLTVALIEHLLKLRDSYHLQDWPDPVAYLNTEHPTWLEQMPCVIEEGAAQGLINRLLHRAAHIIQRTKKPICIKRMLKHTNNEWALTTVVQIQKIVHVDDLSAVFGHENLPSFVEIFAVIKGNRIRVAACSLRVGAASRWLITEFNTEFSGMEAFQYLTLELIASDICIAQYSWPLDELSENRPWVFTERADYAEFLSSGSYSTEDNALCILLPKSASIDVDEGTLSEFEVALDNYRLYRLTGSVYCRFIHGQYRIQTLSSHSLVVKLDIDGKVHEHVSQLVAYSGPPTVNIDQENGLTSDYGSTLNCYWQGDQDPAPTPWQEATPIGAGEIILKSSDVILDEHPCLILPEKLECEVISTGDDDYELKVIELAGAVIGVDPMQEVWQQGDIDVIGGDLCIIEYHIPTRVPNSLTVSLNWLGNPYGKCDLSLPMRFNELALENHLGILYQPSRDGLLTVDSISRLRLRVLNNDPSTVVRVSARIASDEDSPTNKSSWLKTTRELPITTLKNMHFIEGQYLADLAHRLLRHGGRQTDQVTFRFWVNKEEFNDPDIRVYRYQQHLCKKVHADQTLVTFENNTGQPFYQMNDVHLEAISLLDPTHRFSLETQSLVTEESRKALQCFVLPNEENEACIIWSNNTKGIEPLLVAAGQSKTEHSALLEDFITLPETELSTTSRSLNHILAEISVERDALSCQYNELDQRLAQMAKMPNHEDWSYVDQFMALKSDIDVSVTPLVQRLYRHPSAMVALLLRQESELLFEQIWGLSNVLPFEWASVPLSIWQQGLVMQLAITDQHLQLFADQQPQLYQDVIYQRHFRHLLSKGDYFRSMIKRAFTNRLMAEKTYLDELAQQDDKRFALLNEFDAMLKRASDVDVHHIMFKHDRQQFCAQLLSLLNQTHPNMLTALSFVTTEAHTLMVFVPFIIGLQVNDKLPKESTEELQNILQFCLSELLIIDRQWTERVMVIAVSMSDCTLQDGNAKSA